MFDIKLLNNDAFKWANKDNCYFKGYFFDEKNNLLSDIASINFFLSQDEKKLISGNLNGIYTFIKVCEGKIIIITDSINYFPIFYCNINEKLVISDSWNYLVKLKHKILPNIGAETEFLSIGFVIGNETLDLQILKTRAGEKLIFHSSGKVERIPDYYFLPNKFFDKSYDNSLIHIAETFKNVEERLIKYLDSRTAVIPLSGGFDSRLIVSLLKKHNYENVICFTYGRMTDEVEISRKIAEQLGYKWFFVDYTKVIDLQNYLTDKKFLEYIEKVGNGFSMPFLQEYFAVKYIVDKELIPINSVVLPGHVGDNLGGSYILKSIKTRKNNDKVIKDIVNKYFHFKQLKSKEKIHLKSKVKNTFKNYPLNNQYSKKYNPYIEDWSVKEKFSKLLFHSSNVFNFFNFNVYFPLWDKELVEVFRHVPYKYRENKLLYDDVAIKHFFIPLNIYFSDLEQKVTPIKIKKQKIKDKIRYLFPWKYTLSRLIKHDWSYYYPLTLKMESSLEEKGYKKFTKFKFPAIICRWYLDFIGFYKQNKN